MSSRQLRKLQKQKELEKKIHTELGSSDDEAENIASPATRPRPNLFTALGGGEDDDSVDEEDDQNGKSEAAQEEADVESVPTISEESRKRKNKKKKKRKQKQQEDAPIDHSGLDDIDKALKELGIKPRDGQESPASNVISASSSTTNNLLKINTKNLKAVHEMTNMFGRDIIQSVAAEEEQENNRQRLRARHADLETWLREPPSAKKLPEVALRRNIFIQGREHWPRATTGGLSMKEIGKAPDASSTEYAYSHDNEYVKVQHMFFSFVHMGNPQYMIQNLKAYPYHVPTLLQVSSIAKQEQNMAFAAELCERALFALGRTTTSSFRQDLENGKARMDFKRPENRPLWLAGYHYIKSLIRKGTYRTALEWAKLVFSLDPKDPYAMRHLIHVLALRAHESRWLLDFLDELAKSSDAGDTTYLQQTRILALLQLGDAEGARALAEEGMQQVPWLYCALFQELNLDAPPSIWGISAESEARKFWVKLYLYQAKELWDNPGATWLLQDVAKGLGRVNTADLPADDAPADRGAVRLAFLDGQTGLLAVAPREFLEARPNYECDPLPPPREENVFESTTSELQFFMDAGSNPGPSAAAMERMQQQIARLRGQQALADGEDIGDLDEDEEQLQADLAAAIAASSGGEDDSGIIAGLMRMFGLGGRPANETMEDEGEGEDVPGSWPSEQ